MINLSIYTDGSHIKGTIRAGFGACFISPITGKMIKYNERIAQEYFVEKYQTMVSNPTAELMAAVMVMEFGARYMPNHRITIVSDYVGVEKWITGGWAAKKPYIQDLVKKAKEATIIGAKVQTIFKFKWIKGHNGNKMNTEADKLAKKETPYNGFTDYVTEMDNAIFGTGWRKKELHKIIERNTVGMGVKLEILLKKRAQKKIEREARRRIEEERLRYEQWEEENREKFYALFEQTGATREMDFDFERELERAYKRC